MPCTLEPWEVAIEERRANIQKYGLDITDREVMTRLLCEASRKLENHGINLSDEHALWWKAHQERDRQKQ
jgi:hypothetical protein